MTQMVLVIGNEFTFPFLYFQEMMNLDENERVLSRGFPNVHHVNDSSMVC